jgi:hypothetical protein
MPSNHFNPYHFEHYAQHSNMASNFNQDPFSGYPDNMSQLNDAGLQGHNENLALENQSSLSMEFPGSSGASDSNNAYSDDIWT